jgi:hypothetical protein
LADAGFFVGFDLGDAAVVDGDLDGAEADGADFFPDDGEPDGFVGGGGGLGVGAHGWRGWWDCMATECPLVKWELVGRSLVGIGGGVGVWGKLPVVFGVFRVSLRAHFSE